MNENLETKTLYPSRIKSVVLLSISVLLTYNGIMMINEGRPIGWPITILFLLGFVLFLMNLLPQASYLRLSKDGFEIKALFRSSFTKWTDVAGFSARRLGFNKMVVFDYTEEYKELKGARKFAKSLTSAEAALPDTYGLGIKGLMELMNEWRLRVVK